MRAPEETNRCLYSDPMVDIFDDHLLIKRFYLLWLGSRQIRFIDIESLSATNLKPLNGRFRLQGSDNLRTWWPLDWARPNRRWAFIIRKKNTRFETGLTVEDYEKALGVLQKCLGSRFHDARENR